MEICWDKKSVARTLLLTTLFNTVIALLITHLGFGAGFLINFILSQSIGLCICCAVMAAHLFMRNPLPAVHGIVVLGAMIIGAGAGAFLGSLIAGIPLTAILRGKGTLFF